MSYIIFTQPRSGSTLIQTAIRLALKSAGPNAVLNLSEFLNTACTDSFGDLSKGLIKRKVNALVLRDDIDKTVQGRPLIEILAIGDPRGFVNLCLQEVELSFDTRENFDKFVNDELAKRMNFLSAFPNIDYVIKHFIKKDRELAAARKLIELPAKNILCYRRDIVDTTYSSLIKYYLFTLRDEAMYTNFREKVDAHNWNGNLRTIEPLEDIVLTEEEVVDHLESWVNLMKFYKEIKFDHVIVYEDVANNVPVQLDIGTVDLLKCIQESKILMKEQKMSYSVNKAQFFKNPAIVAETVARLIDKNDLKDVTAELGIVGPW